jgi:hypothetical protein
MKKDRLTTACEKLIHFLWEEKGGWRGYENMKGLIDVADEVRQVLPSQNLTTLKEQQAHAWSLAPDDAKFVGQEASGWWLSIYIKPLRSAGKYIQKTGHPQRLFKAPIGNWHWTETLQSREQWEKEMKQDEFVPSVGDICEAFIEYGASKKWRKVEILKLHPNKKHMQFAVYCLDLESVTWATEFRPIKSEADKARERCVQALSDELFDFYANTDGAQPYETAKHLISIGYIKPSPNQFIATRLSDMKIREEVINKNRGIYPEQYKDHWNAGFVYGAKWAREFMGAHDDVEG